MLLHRIANKMKLVKRAKFDCSLFCWIILYIVGASEPRMLCGPQSDMCVPCTCSASSVQTYIHANERAERTGGSVWLRLIPMGDKSGYARAPIKWRREGMTDRDTVI